MAFNAKGMCDRKLWESHWFRRVVESGKSLRYGMANSSVILFAVWLGGAGPLAGAAKLAARIVKDFNQGGMLWTFKIPKPTPSSPIR